MNEELELELEIVELGDAKEETKGAKTGIVHESSTEFPFRPE